MPAGLPAGKGSAAQLIGADLHAPAHSVPHQGQGRAAGDGAVVRRAEGRVRCLLRWAEVRLVVRV